jgi:dolichyl-phosphate beta-glucosyltransferase
MPELTVIIPAFNEERRLPSTLESVHQYLSTQEESFEIIIVDDGSLDRTVEIVNDFAKHHEGIRLLSYSPNQGKGYAVRAGIKAAQGELVLIDDADGASPIEELASLKKTISEGADLAIGSRAKPDQTTIVDALPYRRHLGNTFNLFVQSLVLPGIYDTQCGFKLFKRPVAQDIFSISKFNGYAFDVEVLYIATVRGYKIAEVPINWHNVEWSKVHVLIDAPTMLIDVIKIAIKACMGQYGKKAKP